MTPTPKQTPRATPPPPPAMENLDIVPRNNNKVPRSNNDPSIVPRNNHVVDSSDARVRVPLENIPSTKWYNSQLTQPRVIEKRSNECKPVPRIMQNIEKLIDECNENMHPPHLAKTVREERERERRVLFMRQEMFPVAQFQDE